MENDKWWYLNSSDEVIGPLSVAELKVFLIDQILAGDSLICREGEDTWIPLGALLEGSVDASFFDHFGRIDELIDSRGKKEQEDALLGAAETSSVGGMGFAAGPLHSDAFGNEYVGNSPFPVGKLEHSPLHAGTIRTDAFGNLFSGDSHLSVGHTEKAPLHEGDVHADHFGNLYAGDSHLPIGHLDPNGHH